MKLIGKIKNILGLSEDYLEDEVNGEDSAPDATVTPLSQRRAQAESTPATPETSPAGENVDPSRLPDYPMSMPEDIFTTVIEVFNAALPDFLRKSVNPDAQKKYIFDSLSQSMKEYIAHLDEIARQRCEIQWNEERSRMTREIENVRQNSRRMEESSSDLREQKLSAERQKRALSERVHDLEKQVDTLQAEREQFDLENRSLVNRIRVLTTQEGDLDELRKDNDELRAEVNRLKAAAASAQPAETVDTAALQQEIEDANALTAEFENENKRLTETISSLNIDVETLKKRCEIADSMINDLNSRLGAARKESTEQTTLASTKTAEVHELEAEINRLNSSHEAEVARLNSELESLKTAVTPADDTDVTSLNARIAQLEEQQQQSAKLLADKDSELQQAKSEVEEARNSLSEFADALEKIEAAQEAREKRVAKLQTEVNERNEEIETLKSTIAHNLEQQARSEAVLREEIESLKKQSRNGGEPSARRKATSKPSPEIDDSLDDTNWLVAADPTDTKPKQEDDFGYKEPKRQPVNDDPAQLSLF